MRVDVPGLWAFLTESDPGSLLGGNGRSRRYKRIIGAIGRRDRGTGGTRGSRLSVEVENLLKRGKIDARSAECLAELAQQVSYFGPDIAVAVTFGGAEPIHVTLGAVLDRVNIGVVSSDVHGVQKGTCRMIKVNAACRRYTLAMHVDDVEQVMDQPEVVTVSTDGIARAELHTPKLAPGEISLIGM